MGETSGLNCNAGAFARITAPQLAMARGNWQPSQKKIPLHDTVFAFGFLILYLIVYLAIGFAGIATIEWAWAALFR
jgi:hypothetical protein